MIIRQGGIGGREEHGELIELGSGLTLAQNADGQPKLSGGDLWGWGNPVVHPGALIKEDFGRSDPTAAAWITRVAGKIGNNDNTGVYDFNDPPNFYGYKPLRITGGNHANRVNTFYSLEGAGLRRAWARNAMWIPSTFSTATEFYLYFGPLMGYSGVYDWRYYFDPSMWDEDLPAFWMLEFDDAPDLLGRASLASLQDRWVFTSTLQEMSDTEYRFRMWEGANLKIDTKWMTSFVGAEIDIVQMAYGYDPWPNTSNVDKIIAYGLSEVIDADVFANPYGHDLDYELQPAAAAFSSSAAVAFAAEP